MFVRHAACDSLSCSRVGGCSATPEMDDPMTGRSTAVQLRGVHRRTDANSAQRAWRERVGKLERAEAMTADHGFTEDQKQYLEAFIVGIATRRGVRSVDAAATSTAANPYPADPMAIHYEAQDRAVVVGKLAA